MENSIVFQSERETVFLSVSEHEHFEERAAIMEYEAGLNREDAERMAMQKIIKGREKFKRAV